MLSLRWRKNKQNKAWQSLSWWLSSLSILQRLRTAQATAPGTPQLSHTGVIFVKRQFVKTIISSFCLLFTKSYLSSLNGAALRRRGWTEASIQQQIRFKIIHHSNQLIRSFFEIVIYVGSLAVKRALQHFPYFLNFSSHLKHFKRKSCGVIRLGQPKIY